MSNPITDEIVALENALEKRDETIARQRELLERARAIVSEAIEQQIWRDDRLSEDFYRKTLADIEATLNETP